MPIAFVLINLEKGSEGEALQSLNQVREVEEAYSVYGVYDIVAKIYAESMDELKDTVTSKIRRLSMVRTTLALMVIE